MRLTLVTAVVLALLAGCDSRSGGSGTPAKATIAVIPKGTTHEFWKSVHFGAMKAAKELDVEILWKGPLQENDRQGQINEVEAFINRGVTGICLAPLDSKALRKYASAAMAKKIPVVIFDSGLEGDDYVSYVATDNYKGGRLAGEHLSRVLGGKGKVALLRYMEGSESTVQREQGFLDAIAGSKGIEVVSSNQYAGATADTALKASENLLASLKTADGGLSIDGLFCPNESSAIGMLRALQTAKLAGKIKFVGFDSSERLVAALKSGELNGTVLQNPIKMGYLAVKTIIGHLRGGAVEKRVDTGVVIATPENMEEADIHALLHPEQAP
ncbi:MAG TPA: substrate-binding domain-containing protein [Planctomycetota bacterium]|nr:substrate-binding domain-containing protein [Planctomycetota bacterium]